MEQKNTDVKVPLISKIAYGMGDVGCNFSWMFVGNFLMIFYTDVFGIGMGAVAGLMLFFRFWDAINPDCRTTYRCCAYADILGASGVAFHGKDRLYGGYLLYLSVRLYLCEYPVWDTVRRDDAEYRRTGKN